MEKIKKQIEINAVSNGWGDQSLFIKVGNTLNKMKIVKIEREGKQLSSDLMITCYVAYDKMGNRIVEINEGYNVEVYYSNNQ